MRAPLILITACVLALALQLWALGLPDAADSTAPLVRARPVVAAVMDAPNRTPYPLRTPRSPFDLASSAGAVAGGGDASGAFSLAGLIRAGGTASAVIRDPSGAGHVLRPGESVQGWRLERVGRDDVTLSRGAEHRTLNWNGPPAVLNRTSP